MQCTVPSGVVAAIPHLCFDPSCANFTDRTLLVLVGLPALVLFSWIVFLLRPVPLELQESGKDKDTGTVSGKPGPATERDQNVRAAMRCLF